jgi:hypothetical protein
MVTVWRYRLRRDVLGGIMCARHVGCRGGAIQAGDRRPDRDGDAWGHPEKMMRDRGDIAGHAAMLALGVAWVVRPVLATGTVSYVGPSGSWLDANNWSPGRVPQPSDDVVLYLAADPSNSATSRTVDFNSISYTPTSLYDVSIRGASTTGRVMALRVLGGLLAARSLTVRGNAFLLIGGGEVDTVSADFLWDIDTKKYPVFGIGNSAVFKADSLTFQSFGASPDPTSNYQNGSSRVLVTNNLSLGIADRPASYSMADSSQLTIGGATVMSEDGASLFTQFGGTHATGALLMANSSVGTSLAEYQMSGGSLQVSGPISVGKAGHGIFTQSGGSITQAPGSIFAPNIFFVGEIAGSIGEYSISAGTLSAATLRIGYSGQGTLRQSGGTLSLSAPGGLIIATNAGASGTVVQSGGEVSTSRVSVGYNGIGSYTQTGGAVGAPAARPSLTLGDQTAGVGTYTLSSPAGQTGIFTSSFVVGGSGVGRFIQTSGNVSVDSDGFGGGTFVGNDPGAQGTYELRGGELNDSRTSVGYQGVGLFVQSGGLHRTTSDIRLGELGTSLGSYILTGGSLASGSLTVGYAGSGTFRGSGGLISTTDLTIAEAGGAGSLELLGPATANVIGMTRVGADNGSGLLRMDAGASLSTSNLNVGSTGSVIVQGGVITGSTAQINGLVRRTAGTLSFDSTNLGTGARLELVPPGTGVDSNVLRTRNLTLSNDAQLDLGRSLMVIDYTSASPLAAIAQLVTKGRGGLAGILSSASDARTAVGYGEATQINSGVPGLLPDSSSLLVRWTLRGDANLDGAVNFSDLVTLASHYRQAGTWAQGDFDDNGSIGFSDLLQLAANYGQSLSGIGASPLWTTPAAVPEPMSLPVASGVAILFFGRRRQRRA